MHFFLGSLRVKGLRCLNIKIKDNTIRLEEIVKL